MKEKIKHYLMSGLKPVDICTILGCSAGYISQLLKDENFKRDVEAGMTSGSITQDERMDARYDNLETRIVENMALAAEGAALGELSRAMDSVTRARVEKAKLRLPGYGQPTTVIQNLVSVSLPAHALAAPTITLNEQSEVIAIDNKPMAPLSADGVKNLFTQLQARKAANEFEEVSHVSNVPASTLASTQAPAAVSAS
jgi:hypothetical protein